MFKTEMRITRCKNGWILQLPELRNEAGQAMEMLKNLPGIIKGATQDPLLEAPMPGKKGKGKKDMLDGNYWISAIDHLVDENIYVFLSFRELMGFLELSFESVNE